mmetsp:Transcript_111108/g.313470  ORF Transcript_111108/g.313470 Transcript_111108/m.313470 type:complete len:248 (+) Transcript_111108:94-837(+)
MATQLSSTQQPGSWGTPALPFLAVGRVQDGVILAYYNILETEQQKELNKDVFRKLLTAASTKLKSGQRTRLQWNDGSVCCLMDQQGALLYCVVTTLLTYPERLAYQLLYDFVVAVQQQSNLEAVPENALNEVLRPRMEELVKQYEDPKNFPHLHLAMDALQQPGSGPDPGAQGHFAGATTEINREKNYRKLKIAALAVLLIVIAVFVLYWLWQSLSSSSEASPDPEAPNAAAAIEVVASSARDTMFA